MKPSVQKSNLLLQTHGLCKEFDRVRVLSNVDFDLNPGEIHALIGENGAGKSTFVKIISGVYQATSGSFDVHGKQASYRSAKDCERDGIFTIHQEINLVPYFNAYQNIFIANELTNRLGLLSDKEMAQKAEQVLAKLNIHLDVYQPIMYFNTSIQRIIQISTALILEPSILIFDEPTTALGEEERIKLLEIIKGLKKTGIGIIFISHNIEEIVEIADRVTVFKDGYKVGTVCRGDFDAHKIVSMMIGNKDYEVFVRANRAESRQEVLKVSGVRSPKLKDISFSLHKGEILGVAGLVGAGKSELACAIFGLEKVEGGQFFLNGQPYRPNSTMSVRRGLALVPEERRVQGLVGPFTVSENVSLAYMGRFTKSSVFMDRKLEDATAKHFIDTLSIKTTGPRQIIRYLSGGNQQKVVLSKWLTGEFDVLILDEPTKGIDVRSKRDIYQLIHTIVEQGKSVLFMSSYLPELLNLCNRILVMHEKAIVGEFTSFGPDTKQEITHAMLGGKQS